LLGERKIWYNRANIQALSDETQTMSISLEEVERIAKLARLKFTEPEKQKMQAEMSAILGYVDQLKKIDGLAASMDELDPDAVNLMRDDVAEMVIPAEEFLKQAPEREGDFFKVKSVLE
jgi:aspartyl-tRNA(Asn)/glutamyl-tRNA(Gln) amidotransferase subunit C